MGFIEYNNQKQIDKYSQTIEINTWEEIVDEDFEENDDEYSEEFYEYDLSDKDVWFEYYISHGLDKYLILNDISLREDYVDSIEYIFETFKFNPIFKEFYESVYHYYFEVISELFEHLIFEITKSNVEKKNIDFFHNIIIDYLFSPIKKI